MQELLPWKASGSLQVTSKPELQPQSNFNYFSVFPLHLSAKSILPEAPWGWLRGKHLSQGEQQALVGIWGIWILQCGVWAPEQKEGKRNEYLCPRSLMLNQPGCARGAQTLWNGCWQQE